MRSQRTDARATRQQQQNVPDDYVCATGEMHTVREFVEKSFAVVGTKVAWKGEGIDEVGVDAKDPERTLVRVDPQYFRPTEVELLLGDPTKAKKVLGWQPKVLFEDLVKEMTLADLDLLEKGDHNA